jgi:hypothetical protein
MHACETCGEEFETLSQLRMEHDPCPVEEAKRKREAAIQRLKEERSLEIGELCRVLKTGREALIVDVEPADDGDPVVVWVPVGRDDEPEHRRRSPFDAVV